MQVRIGNAHAIDTWMEGTTLKYRDMGAEQRVTTISLPDGTGVVEAFSTVIAALDRHLFPGTKPAWIEIDNAAELEVLFAEHWSLPDDARRKPIGWGEDLQPVTDAPASSPQEG